MTKMSLLAIGILTWTSLFASGEAANNKRPIDGYVGVVEVQLAATRVVAPQIHRHPFAFVAFVGSGPVEMIALRMNAAQTRWETEFGATGKLNWGGPVHLLRAPLLPSLASSPFAEMFLDYYEWFTDSRFFHSMPLIYPHGSNLGFGEIRDALI